MAISVFLVLVSTRTATSSTALLAPQGAPTDNVVTRVGYAPTACPQMNCLRDTRAQQRRPLWEELPLRGQLLQLSDGAYDNWASSTFYYHYNYTMTGIAAGVLQWSGRGQRQDLLPPVRRGAADGRQGFGAGCIAQLSRLRPEQTCTSNSVESCTPPWPGAAALSELQATWATGVRAPRRAMPSIFTAEPRRLYGTACV